MGCLLLVVFSFALSHLGFVFVCVQQFDLAVKGQKQKKERVVLIETNRARNLVITCRRVGLDYDTLNHTILGTYVQESLATCSQCAHERLLWFIRDLTGLGPEHAQLLLNYLPTDEEAAAIGKHSHHKVAMGGGLCGCFFLQVCSLRFFCFYLCDTPGPPGRG
jgi:hypothetical protein